MFRLGLALVRLDYSENYVAPSTKECVKEALTTLGLKSILADDAGIISQGSSTVDEVIKDVFSDPELMPNDEIIMPNVQELVTDQLKSLSPIQVQRINDVHELAAKELWRIKHVSRDKPPSVQSLAFMRLLQSHESSSLSDLTIKSGTPSSISTGH
nr:hypothetical protein [Tanacetum cinerariifolium]